MKKSLSLLVAIAMVFSMFATVVSAAEEQQPTAGEYLNELGVILGNQDGDLKEDQTWKRQDIVVLLSRLFGAEEEAKDADKTHEFTDVTDANYDGYISWAVEEGLVKGKSATVFGYGDELENRDFYLLVLRALGQEVEYDLVGGTAVEAGLAPEDTDFDAVPLRGATYTAIVTALKTPVGENGETLEELLGLVEAAAITSTQTGVKQVTVKFNKAVDDTKAKFAIKNGTATREVAKVTFSEDKTTAILETTTKIVDGASTVTVTGLSEQALVAEFTAAAEKVTAIEFTSDQLALGTNTDNSPKYNEVSVGYKIVNQFDEDVTRTAGGSLTFQVGKAGASGNANNGVLTITGANFQVGESVYVSAILNLSTYGITATKTFTVGQQAIVDTIDVLSLYHPENKELTTSSDFSEFYVLVDAKDQYGNKVSLSQFKYGVFAIASNATLFTVNKDNAVDGVGPNNDKIGIPLTEPNLGGAFVFEGTNTVRVTTLFGQKSDSIDVPVKKSATLTTITLSQPTAAVSPGQKVKIPFEALDQNGNALTNFKDLDGKLHLSASNGTTALVLGQDFATKKAYLEWTAGPVGINFLTVTVSGTPNTSQLQVTVVDPGTAQTVAGLKDINNTLVLNGTVKIEPKHIVIKDQHDRDMKLADLLNKAASGSDPAVVGTHVVKVYAADGNANNVTGTGFGGTEATAFVFDDVTDALTLSGAVKGTERIKIELHKVGATPSLVSTHESFIFNVIDSSAFESYEVSAPEKISTEADHEVTVKVIGKRTNGTTAELPASGYTVAPTTPLTVDGNKLSADGVDLGGANRTKVVTYTVVISSASGVAPISKEITITNEALIPTTLEQKDAGTLKAANLVVTGSAAAINNNLDDVLATVKVKDQFGVELDLSATNAFRASIQDLDDVAKPDGAALLTIVGTNGGVVTGAAGGTNITGVSVGDSFTVTFTSVLSGKSITVKVVATTA